MVDDMRRNLPLLGYEDYEDQLQICLGVVQRFEWYKRFVCPLPVSLFNKLKTNFSQQRPDSDSSEPTSYESYDTSDEENEAIDNTNVVNRNLNPPFTEVNEINLHNQQHTSQIDYDKEQVSQSISRSVRVLS